jgi:hypothetical protein
MKKFLAFSKAFVLIFSVSGAAACALYFGLKAWLLYPPILVPLSRAPVIYLEIYPIPFLITLVALFALPGSVWLVFIAPRLKNLRWLQISMIPFLTIAMAGPAWGALEAYYIMTVEGFHDFSGSLDYLAFGAQIGWPVGFISALVSFPLNLLSYAMACALLYALQRSSMFQPRAKAV